MNLLETLQYTNGWKIQKIERSKLMRKKSFKLNNVQLNPSKTKESLLAKKKKKNNGVWYLALSAFFITVFVIGYFS